MGRREEKHSPALLGRCCYCSWTSFYLQVPYLNELVFLKLAAFTFCALNACLLYHLLRCVQAQLIF